MTLEFPIFLSMSAISVSLDSTILSTLFRNKVGFTMSQATKALKESRAIALLYFWPRHLGGAEESASRPGRSLPPGKTRYPLYRSLGGPQSGSGQVRKISPPPGFVSRTVQPVGSRSKAKWTGHILRTNHLLKQVTEEKIEVRGRRARRRKQILGDLK